MTFDIGGFVVGRTQMVFIRWRAGDNVTGKDSHAEEYVQMRTFLSELGGVKITYQWTVDYIMRVMQKKHVKFNISNISLGQIKSDFRVK